METENDFPKSLKQSDRVEHEADEIIRKHVYSAMAVALIPIPFAEFVGEAMIQMHMLEKLAKIYDVPFSKDVVKSLVGAIISSFLSVSQGSKLGMSLLKAFPGIGYSLGTASVSVISGACTYALGKIFVRHFSEGGTFLDFNAEKFKALYAEMFKEGKKAAASLKNRKKGSIKSDVTFCKDKDKANPIKKVNPSETALTQKYLPVRTEGNDYRKKVDKCFTVSLAATGTALTGALIYSPLGPLSIIGTLYASVPLFQIAADSIRQRKAKIELLDSAATVIMLAGGYYVVSGLAVFTYYLSQKLRLRTEKKSKKSIVNIFEAYPRSVWILKDGTEICIPFESLQTDDIVVISAGEPVPADGIIMQGNASVDQHMLTGESQPAEKGVGDQILAATVVISGKIHIRVKKTGTETVAAEIAEILRNTEEFTTTVESLGQEIADKSVIPTVALSMAAYPALGFGGMSALLCSSFLENIRGTAPISVLNYLHIASQEGILVKDGRSLQLLTHIDTVVFDKTGTLTLQSLRVGEIHIFNGSEKNTVLTLAAAAEYRQNHPFAAAILEEAGNRGLNVPKPDNADYKLGYGITVKINGQRIRVGSERFMNIERIDIPQYFERIKKDSHESGCSLVCVAAENHLIGAIEMHPTISPGAEEVIRQLKNRNISLFIISGDHEKTTQFTAEKLGIGNYFAEVLPKDKAKLIQKLQDQGRNICFIGDGINDSIALKKANVSVSMHGASTAAMDSAQIVLMGKDLSKFPDLFGIASDFENNIKNVFIAVSVPSIVCIGGVLFANFNIFSTAILYCISAISGTAVAMLPYLKNNDE